MFFLQQFLDSNGNQEKWESHPGRDIESQAKVKKGKKGAATVQFLCVSQILHIPDTQLRMIPNSLKNF